MYLSIRENPKAEVQQHQDLEGYSFKQSTAIEIRQITATLEVLSLAKHNDLRVYIGNHVLSY